MVFFNRNFFRSSSSHVLKPHVNKQESREFGAKIIAGSAFFVMRMLCCLILLDVRIRIGYVWTVVYDSYTLRVDADIFVSA